MERQEIIDKLTPIAREVFGQPDMEIEDSQSASNVENWTSLTFMQFLDRIEKEFGFKFKMMELFSLKTMGSIIESISKH